MTPYAEKIKVLSTEMLKAVAKCIYEDPRMPHYPEYMRIMFIDRYEDILEILRERENDSSPKATDA